MTSNEKDNKPKHDQPDQTAPPPNVTHEQYMVQQAADPGFAVVRGTGKGFIVSAAPHERGT